MGTLGKVIIALLVIVAAVWAFNEFGETGHDEPGQAMENAFDETGDAIQNAADETGDMAEDAAGEVDRAL